ncbi:hypothetical protein S96127_1291 [Yersinia pestis]|nr:hypothetical protein S96127_1291 [Yersinia pestis]
MMVVMVIKLNAIHSGFSVWAVLNKSKN